MKLGREDLLAMNDDREDLLEAFERATLDIKLCPNRVWAVAGEKLPDLLPQNTQILSQHKIRHDHSLHQSCNLEYCEYSQRDFTAVQQRHECKSASCMQMRGRFPREILHHAASSGSSTVWNLAGNAMLESPRPYMAISHVWSDGTGSGAWEDGRVNECLYNFFREIAEQFLCEGIWWDTICIPREKAARNKAIQSIQSNYQSARITLVHDCFLRNWNWNPETACFGILMSPWFSRGWTALELANSRKVKVIFKGTSGPVIKDLDEEILAKPNQRDGPLKEASKIIRSLRKEITSLNDLLTVLGSRHTSWPKDLAIISALLVGLTPEEKQQTTYMKILKKIGRISHGHLFHNSATISADLSWCPTSLFKMPVDLSSEPSLTIQWDGIHGMWRAKKADSKTEGLCSWHGSHPLIRQRLQKALKELGRCWLLAKCGIEPVEKALLVKKIKGVRYQYIGALYFHPDLISKDNNNWTEEKVIITGLSITDERKLASGALGPGDIQVEDDQSVQPVNVSEVDMLRRAVWVGDYKTVSELGRQARLHIPDSLGQSPLHLAAERGDTRIVEHLLKRSELNHRSSDGQTALHRAAWGGSASVVKLLLDYDIDPTVTDKDGNLALHIAARMGFKYIVRMLFKRNLNTHGCNKLTALHYAVLNKHIAVALLLLENKAKVNVRDGKLGWTPLHCAAGVGDEELVEILLEAGAEVNNKDHEVGWTPLHLAAMSGYSSIMRLLMVNGADFDGEDKYGWTPRRFSNMRAHLKAASLGRSQNADSLSERLFWTPLHCMSINNQNELFNFLVKNEPNAIFYRQHTRRGDWSPLHFAAENDLRASVQWLLYEGHYIEARDHSGQTPLLLAAKEGNVAVVELFLQKGANMEARDKADCRPISWAARGGHAGVVEMLIEKGAKIEEMERSRLPPLAWAARMGHEAIIEALLRKGAYIEGWILQNDYFSDEDEIEGDSSEDEDESENSDRKFSKRDSVYDYGLSPLSWAARMGHEAAVHLLLERGAKIDGDPHLVRHYNDSNAENTVSPLECAARMGHVKIVELLLSKGAKSEGIGIWIDDSPEHMTPLGWAARMGHLSVVEALVHYGVKIDGNSADPEDDEEELDDFVMTPLSWAAKKGHIDVVRFLLKKGANIEGKISKSDISKLVPPGQRDRVSDPTSPLSWAVISAHAATVELLLRRGANVEGGITQGGNDWDLTPLALAARHRHSRIVDILLHSGADEECLTKLRRVRREEADQKDLRRQTKRLQIS
ncbi:hypothetical protein N7528_008036 [Penicillium herquei]|nr:hypothetical protein N7528_008036 [Penicillium herquei]